jgi:uncharacterized iron-regulated membrane protein
MTTCFTGAMLVFEDELQHLNNKERYFVTPGANNQAGRGFDIIPAKKSTGNILLVESRSILTKAEL